MKKGSVPNGYNWEFTTPARLMFGISYAFGNRGLISVDYERDWYNGMRMKNNPAGGDNEIYNDTFRSWYKGANIVRIGAEFKPRGKSQKSRHKHTDKARKH